MQLSHPFDKFVIEYSAGEYKDFGVAPNDPYPLKGVTYPTDYGELPGYTAEDGAALDVFVGTDQNGYSGYIRVNRPDTDAGEHKVYIYTSADEEARILQAFKPVLASHKRLLYDELLNFIEQFKDTNS